MDEKQEKILFQANNLVRDIEEQFKEAYMENKDVEYWQGKKDGARLIAAFLREIVGEEEWAESTRRLVASSPGGRADTIRILKANLESAAYYIGEVLWAHFTEGSMDKNVDKRSLLYMRNWYWNIKNKEDEYFDEPLSTCFD